MQGNEPTAFEQLISYYVEKYRLVASAVVLQPNEKIKLGHRENPTCRFCGKTQPEVTFSTVAHALPEAIGNKSIEVFYECDDCNQRFGAGIETEFGKWSKPLRTFYQIRGKNGVPTLKREGTDGWRIELAKDGFVFQQHVDNPVAQYNASKGMLCVEVPVDAHVPIAVFKTFVKMALSLVPDAEFADFKWTVKWLRELQHTRPFHADIARLYYTFVSGPRPFEGITAFLFLRKDTVTDTAYCTLVIAVGNECYQVFVPCPAKDKVLQDQKVNLRLLPTPYQGAQIEGRHVSKPDFYDLSGTEINRDTKLKRCFHAVIQPSE